MVNDSNNPPFAKAGAALLRLGFHPQAECQEGNFWVSDAENSDLHKNSPGVSIQHGQKNPTI